MSKLDFVARLGVPVVAVVSALLALRTEDVGPLGLSRAVELPRRRAWWRFALIGAGAALIVVISLIGSYWQVVADARLAVGLGAGIALVLAGTGAVLPWLVGEVAHRRGEAAGGEQRPDVGPRARGGRVGDPDVAARGGEAVAQHVLALRIHGERVEHRPRSRAPSR